MAYALSDICHLETLNKPFRMHPAEGVGESPSFNTPREGDIQDWLELNQGFLSTS